MIFVVSIKQLKKIHSLRSKRAQRTDEALKARKARSPEEWIKNPNRFDVKGVDYPQTRRTKRERIDIGKIYERTWRKAIFKPIGELKPPTPKVVFNPRLKKAIARAKVKILPMKVEGGKIISYPRVTKPTIEVSPYFKTLSKVQKEKVLEHEVMHIIHAQAMPSRRQIHREGSLLSMEKIMLKWKPAGRKKK